jgi:response regulator RpfG family c-di-GMP phosphodiesterase
MEVSFVAEFDDDDEVLRWVESDSNTLQLHEGDRFQLADSYCDRLVKGEIESVVPNVKDHPGLRGLPPTGDLDVGSYVGVPIRFSDGHVYGTLCCLSHEERSDLQKRDLDVVRALAAMVSGELERRELLEKKLAFRLEAAGSEALIAALSARDGYTAEHSDAVVVLSEEVARRLDLSEADIHATHQVALLHDIGKIGIPDGVLRKPGPLDAREWRLMREHPIIGARIVGSIASLKHLAGAIRAEHERWDGKGYPDGLAGEDVPLLSRIVFACDTYHAMISNRPYRKSMTEAVAREELRSQSGAQFDPRVVEALLSLLDEGADVITLDEGPKAIRVMLVDDDASTRMLLRFTLEAQGVFEVVGEAGDGAEALSFVKTEQPDAVVLDLAMPVMSGLQAMPEIRKLSPQTKIVVFSASDPPEVLRKAMRLGADLCLGKGVSLSDVGEALQGICISSEVAGR